MVLTSNSKMLCKTDLPSDMLECPRTASHGRRSQERNVTESSALGARSVGERSKIQRRVRTRYSGAVEEGKASAVPGRSVPVDYGSSESLLVVPNGPENRREWRSEESDCNDLYALSGFGTGPEALNAYTMGTSILHTVSSGSEDRCQARIPQTIHSACNQVQLEKYRVEWRAFKESGAGNALLERTPLFCS